MRNFLYSFYALIFNFCAKLLSQKKNRVAFISMHNENFNDSLGGVYEYMKKEGGFDFVFITRRDLDIKLSNIINVLSFFFVKSRKLAAAEYVFLNDNFMPMSKMRFKKDAVVVQLWHAEGVFKKFGLAIEQPENVRRNEIAANERLSYVVCSSKAVVPYYAEAFSVDEKAVLPLGSARTDYFFNCADEKKSREKLIGLYPELRGKKLVLYAPTFRDDKTQNKDILSHFDSESFFDALGEEYALLLRLHPQVYESGQSLSGAVDVTDYPDVRELVTACDVLITDYSSICMDFSLLNKKTVFFAYDLDEYKKYRDFYFDYESYVPGIVARTTSDIIEAIKQPFDEEKNESFKRFNFDFSDGNSAKRIVESIIR